MKQYCHKMCRIIPVFLFCHIICSTLPHNLALHCLIIPVALTLGKGTVQKKTVAWKINDVNIKPEAAEGSISGKLMSGVVVHLKKVGRWHRQLRPPCPSSHGAVPRLTPCVLGPSSSQWQILFL